MVEKGTSEHYPVEVVVRQESAKNRTLSITLSKVVLESLDGEIKKGDILLQWVEPMTKMIYLRKKKT
jgi:hypothetical protein